MASRLGMKYTEVSALTREGVDDCFDLAVSFCSVIVEV